MLKGSELLAKVAELTSNGQSKTDVARACGYVATKKDGSERVLFSAYCEAIIEAKGVDLGTPAPKAAPKRGKAPSYKATVSKAGTCPVGGAYTSQAGWGPGDEVTIAIDGDEIRLKRTAVAPAATPEAQAPAAAPVVITPTETIEVPAAKVVTYDDAPAQAEKQLAPF